MLHPVSNIQTRENENSEKDKVRVEVEFPLNSSFEDQSHEGVEVSQPSNNQHSSSHEPAEAPSQPHSPSIARDRPRRQIDFRVFLDEELGLILKLRDMMIGWIHEGFQRFFRRLNDELLLLSGQNVNVNFVQQQEQEQQQYERLQGDKVPAGAVLVISQLSVFIEREAISRVTEEIGSSLSLSGSGYAFDPAQVRHTFRAAGERISVLLKKRLTTPNWVKHKEPREVHMFVDMFLQELGAVGREVKHILGEGGGVMRKHARTESNGSTSSSRNNTNTTNNNNNNNNNRSNTNRARSQLLETHLAKLFKQKMEIFTKVQHTQESVVMSIVKLCLKSFQEFVRLQTFNQSGFQQIQLDMQYLRTTLKDTTDSEDEAALEFLLDEVIVAAAERCLDPSPLEPAILDRLVQLKLAR
ncbi:unnamed protein product [Lactuca virosa]|uniref:Vacuolar protein sorting-associated protein 51 homolog n=1 Tax=Lactuca virosa TaxID=75947 RepID=A0AAU9PTW9_9ASTR|nr:unnamed protein product [Lactuca virosa]